MNVLDVGGRHEDEVARHTVDADRGAPGLRVAAGDRESLLLHRGQDVPLQETDVRKFVDEEHPLVRLVHDARYHALVRQGPELRMAPIRVVANVPEQLRLGRSGRHQEGVPVELDQDLARALVLELASALERPLVEHLDLVARPFVGNDLLHPGLEAGRSDRFLRVPTGAHGELEDPADEVTERVAAARDPGRRLLHVPAARAVALGRERVEAASRASVAEPLGDGRRSFRGRDQLPFDRPGRLAFVVDLLPGDHFDAGSFGVLRVVDDAQLGPRSLEVEREGLRGHRLPDAGRTDEQEVPSLVGRDASDLNRLFLADDPLEGVGRDVDVLGGAHLVERCRSAVGAVARRGRHGRVRKRGGR